MLVLGIDTSGKAGGVTLLESKDDANTVRVIETAAIADGTFSAQLVPTLASLLEKYGFTAKDLDGFAVASGPGSFTGLRVGLSAVKGLSEVLGKPIATVSLLEVMAALSGKHGCIASALDAGRKEVFLGVYEVGETRALTVEERLVSQEEFLTALNSGRFAQALTSDAVLAELASVHGCAIKPAIVYRPDSEAVARLGLRKLAAGETVSVELLDANYLRRSDAELFFKG